VPPESIYFWPYDPYQTVWDAIPANAIVETKVGPLARGDLEAEAYPLYLQLEVLPAAHYETFLGKWNDLILLRDAQVTESEEGVDVSLVWQSLRPIEDELVVFTHWLRDGQMIAQADGIPGRGYLPVSLWRPGWKIRDVHSISQVGQNWDPAGDQILIGLYWQNDLERLPLVLPDGTDGVDTYSLQRP